MDLEKEARRSSIQHERFEEAGMYDACIAADVDASELSQPQQCELLDRVIVRDD